MEFYYDEIDNDVLIVTADGGLNADTSEQFVQSIEKLVDAGAARGSLPGLRRPHGAERVRLAPARAGVRLTARYQRR